MAPRIEADLYDAGWWAWKKTNFQLTVKQRESRRETAHTMKFSDAIRKTTRLSSSPTFWQWNSTSFNKGCIQEEHRECGEPAQKRYCRYPPDTLPQPQQPGQITFWQPDISHTGKSYFRGRVRNISATASWTLPELLQTWNSRDAIDWPHSPARVSRICHTRTLTHSHT